MARGGDAPLFLFSNFRPNRRLEIEFYGDEHRGGVYRSFLMPIFFILCIIIKKEAEDDWIPKFPRFQFQKSIFIYDTK